MSSFLYKNHRGSLTLTLLNVLGVLNVLNLLNVLHVLNMLMDASLASWALFFRNSLFFSPSPYMRGCYLVWRGLFPLFVQRISLRWDDWPS